MTRKRESRLGALGLVLVACLWAPRGSAAESTRAALTIDAMDNAQHILRGGFPVDAGVDRVELYEGSVLLGEAQLEAEGRWSIPWAPGEGSVFLEAVAHLSTGTELRTRLDFQHLRFSTPARLYSAEALLTLPVEPGTTTHYTLDGTAPGPSSPVYTVPLVLLSRRGQPAPLSLVPTNPAEAPESWRWMPPAATPVLGTVVRLQRFSGATPVGAGEARTYLVQEPVYSLPVLSLVTNAENFFGYDQGIYVPGRIYDETPHWPDYWGPGNYRQDGEAWERPVHVEWFEATGAPVFAQNAGVRIHGSGSASLPQKSLRLYAKAEYGPEWFPANFFPNHPFRGLKRLLVRASGQDQMGSRIKDCVLPELLHQTQLETQPCRPTVVFLNGEYWGLHEIRERLDEYTLASHYGLNRKKIVILEGPGNLDTGEAGDVTPYAELLAYVRTHDLAVPEHFAYVEARIDVENFIDYHIAQVYFGNDDWPQNNLKYWRYRGGENTPGTGAGDGRWRWLLYDLDYAFMLGPEANSLGRLLHDTRLGEPFVVLFRSLMKSPIFRERFITRFHWHLDNTFTTERVLAVLDAGAARLAPEIPEHISRWGYPQSEAYWQWVIDRLRDVAHRRPVALRRFLQREGLDLPRGDGTGRPAIHPPANTPPPGKR
ncbi:CotH kinase family protein [Myxococcus stipitatus]|uniref:CotH kinase family protein n=1 Tax=Myxococcus stipitatus TaxID=83455 RepID=UPI001E47038F|nr:CotH kinase family protein [Myxococcus stipitatus]